jgi:hypothetical protein
MPRNKHGMCGACLEAGSQHLSKMNCTGKTNSKLLADTGFLCNNATIATAILRGKKKTCSIMLLHNKASEGENGKWESTYLLNKFLKIWYTSFTDFFCSATQQIPINLCSLMAHYKVHQKPPFTSTLSKITPVYTPLFKTYFNIIFPSISTSLLLMSCIVHPPVFHHPNII